MDLADPGPPLRSSDMTEEPMHKIDIPRRIIDRGIARRGTRQVYGTLDPVRTALLVIDMQNSGIRRRSAHRRNRTHAHPAVDATQTRGGMNGRGHAWEDTGQAAGLRFR